MPTPQRKPKKRKRMPSYDDIRATMSELGKKYGKLGGDARAKNLTQEELSAIGRKAANARWAAEKKKKKG